LQKDTTSQSQERKIPMGEEMSQKHSDMLQKVYEKEKRLKENGPASITPVPQSPKPPPQIVPTFFYEPAALVAANKLPSHLVKPTICPLCAGTLSDKPYRLEQKDGKYILPWRCRSCGNFFIMMISLNPDGLQKDINDGTGIGPRAREPNYRPPKVA